MLTFPAGSNARSRRRVASVYTQISSRVVEPPAEALRTATTTPARFFGRQDREGAIAAGMRADLLLLDADPLVDIQNTRKIQAVVLRGHLYDRGALDQMLRDVKAEVARR